MKWFSAYSPGPRRARTSFFLRQRRMGGEREQLPRLADLLEHNGRLAELGRISASVVHELNTPLSVIASAAQLVLREEELSPSAQEMVERIALESQRLSALIRGILSFARTGGEGEGTDVCACLRDVLALLRYEVAKRSVSLSDRLAPLPPVAAEENRLKQVFLNLVMNALHAMENGGELSLEGKVEGEWLEVAVADTGKGIPPAALEAIFEPFYTTKPAGEGTGLGLFVCRSVVEAYGGDIRVTSSPGEGSRFTVRLPLSR